MGADEELARETHWMPDRVAVQEVQVTLHNEDLAEVIDVLHEEFTSNGVTGGYQTEYDAEIGEEAELLFGMLEICDVLWIILLLQLGHPDHARLSVALDIMV